MEGYIDNQGLEALTPRTIVQPARLHAHLNKVHMVGVATDFEEFAENLCCVAAPVEGKGGKVEGAIGLSTTAQRAQSELRIMVDLVQQAAEESSALLSEDFKAGAGGKSRRTIEEN